MTDLRKAAKMALEALEDYRFASGFERPLAQDAIDELRQALAQPEQGNSSPNYPISESITTFVDAVNMSQERVDETAKGEQEPYGYVWTSLRDGMEVRFSRMPPNKFYNPQDIKPVYTAPPKREWVGLTRRELDIATLGLEDLSDCYKAIEAKLKEKNT